MTWVVAGNIVNNFNAQYNWRGKNLTLYNFGLAPGTVYTESAGGPPGPRSFARQKAKSIEQECLIMVLYWPGTKNETKILDYAFYHWDGLLSLTSIK